MSEPIYINGYKLLQPFQTAGGGMCRWTFAEKGGKAFFCEAPEKRFRIQAALP